MLTARSGPISFDSFRLWLTSVSMIWIPTPQQRCAARPRLLGHRQVMCLLRNRQGLHRMLVNAPTRINSTRFFVLPRLPVFGFRVITHRCYRSWFRLSRQDPATQMLCDLRVFKLLCFFAGMSRPFFILENGSHLFNTVGELLPWRCLLVRYMGPSKLCDTNSRRLHFFFQHRIERKLLLTYSVKTVNRLLNMNFQVSRVCELFRSRLRSHSYFLRRDQLHMEVKFREESLYVNSCS